MTKATSLGWEVAFNVTMVRSEGLEPPTYWV